MYFLGRTLKLLLLGFAVALLSPVWFVQLAAAPVQLHAEAINKAEPSGKNQRNLSPAVIARAQILLGGPNSLPARLMRRMEKISKKQFAPLRKPTACLHLGDLQRSFGSSLFKLGPHPLSPSIKSPKMTSEGPFSDLPPKMEDMKDLPAVPYTSAAEALAEKFHMSEELLRKLNAESSFDRAGDKIFVPNILTGDAPAAANRVEIAKAAQTVRVFDAQNNIIAFYPATVGSDERPSPSGTLKVTNIQANPFYRYNPKYRFEGVSATKPFTIKPGPNNPVGLVWIGLAAEGFGIHGTPDPAKVSKAESHGCIRLTNWDADDLSKRVTKGTPVVFVDGPSARSNTRHGKRNG